MFFKLIIFACAIAAARAGGIIGAAPVAYGAAPVAYGAAPVAYGGSSVAYGAAPVAYGAYAAPVAHAVPAVTSQHQNILRSYGNLGQVSTYSKTIDTPFSSVSKSDVRVSNPGYATIAHAAPVATYAAAPVVHHAAYAAAPVVHHAAYAAPAVVAKSYAAPVATYASAPVVHHAAYAAPAVVAKSYAAPAVVAGPAVARAGLLGVAYSAAPVVSHMTYANSYGVQYGW